MLSREDAKVNREKKDYESAEPIYCDIWSSKGENWDKWLGWEYADTLKRLGKFDEAILISKVVYQKFPNFKYNNDLLTWLLYEKYVKPISDDSTYDEKQKMLSIAEFIIRIVKQEGKKTAFECTVFKVLEHSCNKEF